MALQLSERRSRRSLLTGAVGAVAGAVAATLAGAHAGLAAGDDGSVIHVGDSFIDVRSDTYLFNQATDDPVLTLRTQGQGTCVDATSVGGMAVRANSYGTATAVTAFSGGGTGVYGRSFGTGVYGSGANASSSGVVGSVTANKNEPEPASIPGVGVYGVTDVSTGRGVYGSVTSPTDENYGVLGSSQSPLGRAVFGWSLNESAGGTGVWGQSSSATGVGVRGYAWDGYGKSGKFGTGVLGTSGSHAFPPPAAVANTGVAGFSTGGPGVFGSGNRGGVFLGSASQVRLVPSSLPTHPANGFAGDLFVDASRHLWFCQGGTTWKKIV